MKLANKTNSLCTAIALLFVASNSLADPIWQCSRTQATDAQSAKASKVDDQFSIASFGSSSDVISISIRDLIDIYSGTPVRIGGLPLSACFMLGDGALSQTALTSLGLKSQTIQALARKSSIVQNNLFYVSNEEQMLNCIAKNFPSVGYLSAPKEDENSLPCF